MKNIIVFILLAFSTTAFGQVVIPDNAQIDLKAELKVYSTNKGMTVPRLTPIQMYSIVKPADGLLVYNTSGEFYCYNNTVKSWEPVSKTLIYTADPATFYEGEYYYNTTDGKLHYRDNAGWVIVGLTGNTL